MKTKRNLIQRNLLGALLLITLSATGGVVTTLADGGAGSLRENVTAALECV